MSAHEDIDVAYLRRALADANARGDYWRDLVEPCERFTRWIISLDDQEGPGFEDRKVVTMAQIIGKAREALAQPEE